VDLTLTARCQPDCENVSFSLIKSVPYLTINLPGGTTCSGSPHQSPYTVDIAPGAPPGDYQFAIVGTIGDTECSTIVTITVTGDVTMALNPSSIAATTTWTAIADRTYAVRKADVVRRRRRTHRAAVRRWGLPVAPARAVWVRV